MGGGGMGPESRTGVLLATLGQKADQYVVERPLLSLY